MLHAPAVILLLISTAMLADSAMACSCARDPTAETILEGAAVVFTGAAQHSVPAAPGRSVTTFTVAEPFKGAAAGATVRVLHPSGSSASCGVRFSPGETYTLAAHRGDSDPGLETSLCSTWMFAPQVGTGAAIIQRMREIRGALTPMPGDTAAAETCWTGGHAQFFNAIHYCVSSVLAPQGEETYGPENLAKWEGDVGKAWCEGVPEHGIGETITIRIEGAVPFRRLLVGNGYSKSLPTYTENGRVKTVEITSDTGMSARVNFPDRSDIVPVDLPQMAQQWIALKIVDVYPGDRSADSCLSFLMPDFEYEEELLLKEQGLIPK